MTDPVNAEDDLVDEFLAELDGWEQAYPLSAFPEPDLKTAAKLLKDGGMTLDAISASNMRHVISRLAPKARAALEARDGEIGRLTAALTFAEAETRRYAAFYPQASDGRNTLVMLADSIARQALNQGTDNVG